MKATQLGDQVRTLRSQTMSFSNDGLELSLHLPDANEVKDTFSNFVNTIDRQDKSIVGLKARLNITQESLRQKDTENQKLTQALAHALIEIENNNDMFQKEMRNFIYNVQGYESKEISKPKNLKTYLNTFKVAMPTLSLPEDKEVDPDVEAYIASEVNIVRGITLDSKFATEEGARPQSNVSFQSSKISRSGSLTSIPPPLESQSSVSVLPFVEFSCPRDLNPLPRNPSKRWRWAIKKVIKNNRLSKLHLGLVNIRNEPSDSIMSKMIRLEGDLYYLSSSIKEELNRVINEHFNSLNEKIDCFESQLNDFKSRYQLDYERNERKFKETENEFQKVNSNLKEYKIEQESVQQINLEKFNKLTSFFNEFYSYDLNNFQNEILFLSQNISKLENSSISLMIKCQDNSLTSHEEAGIKDSDDDELEATLKQLLLDDIKLAENKKDYEELSSNFIRYETNVSRIKNLIQLFNHISTTTLNELTTDQDIASIGNLSETLNDLEQFKLKSIKENTSNMKKIFNTHDKVLRKFFIDYNKKKKISEDNSKKTYLNMKNKVDDLEKTLVDYTNDNSKLILDKLEQLNKSVDDRFKNLDLTMIQRPNGGSTDSVSAETDTNIGGVGTLSLGDSVNGNVLMNNVVSVKREIGSIKQQIKEIREAFFSQLSENLFDFDDEGDDTEIEHNIDFNEENEINSIKFEEEEVIEEIIEVKNANGEIICKTSRPPSGTGKNNDGEIKTKVDESGNEIIVRVKSAKKIPSSNKEINSSKKEIEKSDEEIISKKSKSLKSDKKPEEQLVDDTRKKSSKARSNAIQSMIASALGDDKIEEKIIKILQIILPEYVKPSNIIHHYEHSSNGMSRGANVQNFPMNSLQQQGGFTFPNIQKLLDQTNSSKKNNDEEKSYEDGDPSDEIEKKRLKSSLMGSFVDYNAKKVLANYPEGDNSNSLVSDLSTLKNENSNLRERLDQMNEFLVTKDELEPICQNIVRSFYNTINNHNFSLHSHNQSRENSAKGGNKNSFSVNDLSSEIVLLKNDYDKSISNLKHEFENLKMLTLNLQNFEKDDKSLATAKALCLGCGRPSSIKPDHYRPQSPSFIPTLTSNLPQGNPDVYRGGFKLPGHSPPNISANSIYDPEIPLLMRERVVTATEEKSPLPIGVTLPQILHNQVSGSISVNSKQLDEKNLNIVRFAPEVNDAQYKRNFFRKGLPGKKSSKAETTFAPERFDISNQSIPSLLSASTPNLFGK